MSGQLRGTRLQKIRQKKEVYPESDDNNDVEGDERSTPEDFGASLRFHGARPVSEVQKRIQTNPTLDPYVGKLERYELFCTNQSYYLVGCNKLNTTYRVLKMDRTLIEHPPDSSAHTKTSQQQQQPPPVPSFNAGATSNTNNNGDPQSNVSDTMHTSKPTLRPLSDFLTEDPNAYTQEEIQDMLDMIHDGNRLQREDRTGGDGTGPGGGGLKPICKAYGVVGFIRFLDCYYLTLITRRSKVGSIGGNGIYTIKGTESFPIKPAERVPGVNPEMDVHTDPSSVLLSMWNRGKRSVGLGLTNREIAELRYQGLYQVIDLTKNFFFSYTYDLTRSLQENFLTNTSQPFPPPPFKDMFAWNYFLTRELEACTNAMSSFYWLVPIVHGAFIQRKLSDYGRSLNVILLARRSRHFAGTRYLKRGVNEQGKVANDVEHEQILESASNGIFSSYIQVRGSIPTFWTQESSVTMPKPPIELNRVDPTYTATQKHFEDLMKRYGSPLVVLDLVKQSEKREREVRVGNEYRAAIDYINTSIDGLHRIRYCALDYSHTSKHRHLDVSTSLNEVSTWAVNQTGFFCSAPQWKIMEGGVIEPFSEEDARASSVLPERYGVPVFPMEQAGVLRTNCIDCLDRTNVAQFSAGVEAMGQQLVVMGIRSNPKLDPTSNIVRVLIDMYVDIGDHIALQYGGSEAHKKVNTERSESIVGPIGKHKELLTSIRRYYSNAFTDRLKQDAMNLFLGYYVPNRHSVPLWEMETDYYLHNFHVRAGKGTYQTMRSYQEAFGVVEWNDDYDMGNESGLTSRTNRKMHARSLTFGSIDTAAQNDHTRRIETVRNRCKAQCQALSSWWKYAIQANVQQRMWMQLGQYSGESLLPPRFERLYQPEKLAQFDRFFARAWATPVRRSHAAQHSIGSDEEVDFTNFVRILPSNRHPLDGLDTSPPSADEGAVTRMESTGSTLGALIEQHGFDPQTPPVLRSLVGYHDPVDLDMERAGTNISDEEKESSTHVYDYIGDVEASSGIPKPEYVSYVSLQEDANPFRSNVFEEFKVALRDVSLSGNDVRGIRELASSAQIGRVIGSGPYQGLVQSTSAIEVATLVQEQHDAYENLRNRGELRDGMQAMDSELSRRGFSTDGIRSDLSAGWRRHLNAEMQYSEALSDSTQQCRRSDLTTEHSFKMYSSFFPPDKSMSTTDTTFIHGNGRWHTEKDRGIKPGLQCSDCSSSAFVTRAGRHGISITAHSDLVKSRSQPLFQFDRQGLVPSGFEMINEDMFARKDNKFMVFNGAGVDSWKGTSPVTKTAGIELMLVGAIGRN